MSFAEKPPFSGEDLTKVIKCYFADYCLRNHIAVEDRPKLNPQHFLHFLTAKVPEDTTLPDSDEVAHQLHVPAAAVEFAWALGTKAQGPQHLMTLWPFMVLEHRTHNNPIRSVNVLTIVEFMDHVIVPFSSYAHKDVTTGELKDAEVVAMINAQAPAQGRMIAEAGLDNLHDQRAAGEYIVEPQAIKRLEQLVAADRPNLGETSMKRLMFIIAMLKQWFPEDKEVPVQLRRPDRRYPGPTPESVATTMDSLKSLEQLVELKRQQRLNEPPPPITGGWEE